MLIGDRCALHVRRVLQRDQLCGHGDDFERHETGRARNRADRIDGAGRAGLLAAPAAAATPPRVSHQRLSDSFTTEVCGFTVNNVINGMVTFKTTVDAAGTASYQSEAHVVQRMTNPVNGKVGFLDNAGRDAFSDGGVLNPDGT
jgi:hypothetical protein